jgi:hypothetical protein
MISPLKFFIFFAAFVLTLGVFAGAQTAALAQASSAKVYNETVTSVMISEDFLNEQISLHNKSKLFEKANLVLDPKGDQMFMRGVLRIPLEEMRAINLDPKLGAFRFQMAIRPDTTPEGHLILEFPLHETFFYPATSKNQEQDKIVVPVQFLSVAMASARGYLAALSGDFSGFEKRAEKIRALIKGLDKLIAQEKNQDAAEELKTQRQSLNIQLQAVPVERKQLQTIAKGLEHILSFTGEKELNLNDELGARDNALIFKIKLASLTPFLTGVELGDIKVVKDSQDGHGSNYLSIDVNSDLAEPLPPISTKDLKPLPGDKSSPALILKLHQALFESVAVVSAEKKSMPAKMEDLDLQFKDDGLHISGKWKTFFFDVPFDTIVDFVTTATDVFEVKVRQVEVAGMDVEFLAKYALQAVEKRLDAMLKGRCTFEYLGTEKDKARALRVTVDPAKLVPAFPDLHLLDVEIRERLFILKIGKP